MQYVDVDSTRLIEIGPDHKVWSEETEVDVRDALVKLTPPAEHTDVHAVIADIRRMGARVVKLLAAAPSDKITAAPVVESDNRSHRQVVLDRAARANNIRDVDALNALLNAAFDSCTSATG